MLHNDDTDLLLYIVQYRPDVLLQTVMKLQNISVIVELISVFAGRSEQDDLVAMGTNWNSLSTHRSGRSFSNGGSAIQMLPGNGPSRKFGSRNNITGLNGNYRSHCHKDGEFHDCVTIVVFCCNGSAVTRDSVQ